MLFLAGESTSCYFVAMVCLEPAVEGFWHVSNQAESSKSVPCFESSSVKSTVLFRLFPVWWWWGFSALFRWIQEHDQRDAHVTAGTFNCW